MGGLPGLFGLGSGAAGTSFDGPVKAPIAIGANTPQAYTAYNQTQGAMGQQDQLLSELANQQALQKQSSVYNQMQNVANGTGPNPAQAMLHQQTGQNIANQSAMMAGQRGAGANVGLMARQAAQQGAATQQQAVGQGATMQAQQSLGALGQMSGMANNMAGNLTGQVNQNVSSQQNEQANILNALAGINSTQASMQANVNNVNGQLANTQMQGQQGVLGNMMNTGGSMMGMAAMAEGGGVVAPAAVDSATPSFGTDAAAGAMAAGPPKSGGQDKSKGGGAQSAFGKYLTQGTSGQDATSNSLAPNYAGSDLGQGSGALMAAMGGSTRDFRSGGSVQAANQAEKAVAHGNNYANDKIPAVLSEGEVVIPRNVMQSANPADGAMKFVQAVMAKKGRK